MIGGINKKVRDDNSNKPTRHYSLKQEKDVAKKIKGNVAPNSGATPYVKGDVLSDNWLIECKTCMKPKYSFSIKKEWLEKNKEEQVFMRKDFSALAFNFGPGQDNYYILDEATFLTLKNAFEQH